jgi:hypothetical protein
MTHSSIRRSSRFLPSLVLAAVIACAVQVPAQAQKSWHHRDLTATTGHTASENQLDGFAVGQGGTDPRLYYSDYPEGRVWELAYYQGGWHPRDITAAAGAPIATNEPIAGFREGNTDSRVYYVGAGWHVFELTYSQSQQGWRYRDITAESGAPPRDPNINGKMVAFQVAGTDPRVYYLNAAGHMIELGWYQGGWHHSDITARAGAPPVDGQWTAFPVASTDPRIYYIGPEEAGTRGRPVHELAYYQGGWHHRNLSTRRRADEFSGLTGFAVGPGRTEPRVYFKEPNQGDLVELAYKQGDWNFTEIVRGSGGPEIRQLEGFAAGGTSPRVYATTDDRHILEFSYTPEQDRWRIRDLTADTGAPLHSGTPSLVAFAVDDIDPRVYYLGEGERVHELAWYQDGGGGGGEPTTRTVVMNRQPGEPPVPYEGEFPATGVVPSGRLLQIRVPQIGPVDFSFQFVRAGRSTKDCNDPGAVVEVREGQSTTPDQINAIFGTSEPGFSTQDHLEFRACVGSGTGELPNFRDIEITVRFN